MSKKLRKDIIDKIERNTLRIKTSHRGGGVEIDLTKYGFAGHKMSAYQNYLGGGMLGAIQVNDTLSSLHQEEYEQMSTTKKKKLKSIGENLMRYFHSITNHEDDEWECATFEENQRRPATAY